MRRATEPGRSHLRASQRLRELTSSGEVDAGSEPDDALVLDAATALELLRSGELSIEGRISTASNATFLGRIEGALRPDADPLSASCVYKPIRGERPLSDFPVGTLANREVAAHRVSVATGWEIVPPTILRDGPFGRGMVQLWIDVDEDANPFELVLTLDERLRAMALFDAIVNNADRKVGHMLPTPAGHIHGCDHGVCFAAEPKLRTVLWGWAGSLLADEERSVLEGLRALLDGTLGDELGELLTRREVGCTRGRVDVLLETGRFPIPDPSRPAIPWPPF